MLAWEAWGRLSGSSPFGSGIPPSEVEAYARIYGIRANMLDWKVAIIETVIGGLRAKDAENKQRMEEARSKGGRPVNG